MDLNIKDRTALVFGGSSGLGYAIAKSLVEEGVRVAISSHTPSKLDLAKSELRAEMGKLCDLTKAGEARKAVESVLKDFGHLDILVMNAGGPPAGLFDAITTDQWSMGFQSLWLSAVDAIQVVLPSMKRREWGRILLVTSAAAKEPMGGLTVSNGLRAGLCGLAKSLSQEVGRHGITVNCVLPGYTATERLKELKIGDEILNQIPARRLGKPEEFAAMTTFLASEQAAYITGQSWACDGGFLKAH